METEKIREQGRRIGFDEGYEACAKDIAAKLLANDMSVDDVAELLDVSFEAVTSLQKEITK